jgi:hypothetical protein
MRHVATGRENIGVIINTRGVVMASEVTVLCRRGARASQHSLLPVEIEVQYSIEYNLEVLVPALRALGPTIIFMREAVSWLVANGAIESTSWRAQ